MQEDKQAWVSVPGMNLLSSLAAGRRDGQLICLHLRRVELSGAGGLEIS